MSSIAEMFNIFVLKLNLVLVPFLTSLFLCKKSNDVSSLQMVSLWAAYTVNAPVYVWFWHSCLSVTRSTNKLLLWKTYQKAAAQRCAGFWSMHLTEYPPAEALPPNYCTRRPSIHLGKTNHAVGAWTLRWRMAHTRCYDSSVWFQRAPMVLYTIQTHTQHPYYTV